MYLPDPIRSCCPHYTIRLPAASFKPARSQRQALNRFNRFVLGEKYADEAARVHPKSRDQKKKEAERGFDLLKSIHEPESNRLPEQPKPENRLEISLESDDFTEEKYKVFEAYQREIHHEGPSQISRSGFKRFLCSSPLIRSTREITLPSSQPNNTTNGTAKTSPNPKPESQTVTQPLGSFHQTYRLNGHLIALSVLDLLPHAVSAVYFIYDPTYAHLSLGKVSALREAALALELGYQYYYMGFYIKDCVKMRYKSEYAPQTVLDWQTREWVPLEDDTLEDMQVRMRGVSPDTSSEEGTDMQVDGVPYSRPSEAMGSNATLFQLRFPGLPSFSTLRSQIELNSILASVKIPRRQFSFSRSSDNIVIVPVSILSRWDDEDAREDAKSDSLCMVIAELAAGVGDDVARGMVLDFGGGS